MITEKIRRADGGLTLIHAKRVGGGWHVFDQCAEGLTPDGTAIDDTVSTRMTAIMLAARIADEIRRYDAMDNHHES